MINLYTFYVGKHNKQHYALYSLPNFIRVNGMGGACGMFGELERCIQGFGGEIRGKETTRKN
jgi:hypothetical protein